MEIPVTALRNYYNQLRFFSSTTEHEMLIDYYREENFIKLVNLYEESKSHFKKYCSYDFFYGSKKRNSLPVNPISINGTNDLAAVLYKRTNNIVVGNSKYNFKYIEREISPQRTTGGVFYETGESGRKSGQGGLDFIGWNETYDIPILGEIKVKEDENPFFAIIQLLTYLSELATPNQIKRINYTDLFKTTTEVKNKFYLYIVHSNYNSKNELHKDILEKSKLLARKLEKSIKEIKEIVFLKLDNPSSDLELM